MGTDEWRGLTLESPPRNERVLLAYRTIPGMLAKQPETRWTDVLFPTAKLLELWPSINTPRTDRLMHSEIYRLGPISRPRS